MAALLLAGRTVAAQEPLRGDAARLRPVSNTYDVVVTGDSGTMLVGRHRVEVQEAAFAGSPAWMVVDHRESFEPFVRITAADTVLVGRDGLLPRRWDAHTGDARFVAAFTNDSVYGGATSPLARRTFTMAVPGTLLTSEGALDALMQTLTLYPGWSARAGPRAWWRQARRWHSMASRERWRSIRARRRRRGTHRPRTPGICRMCSSDTGSLAPNQRNDIRIIAPPPHRGARRALHRFGLHDLRSSRGGGRHLDDLHPLTRGSKSRLQNGT